ncbi:MAG: hypothetical protein ACPGES_07750 [Coraliomargarita sp.]
MTPLIFIGFAALVIALIVIGHIQAKKRREAFQLLAQELGFRYIQGRDRGLPSKFHFLQHLDDGSNRYAENILYGDLDGQQAYAFDYHYETYSRDSKGRRQTNHHWFSVFTLELPDSFPELIIKPEGLFAKLGQMLGFDDIDFESLEFSKRYSVKSPDKKFAYDFCNAQMIEFLLVQQDLIIEVDRDVLSLTFRGRLAVEQIRPNIARIQRIRALMPNYLFTR